MIHERHICALVEEMMLLEMLEIDLSDIFRRTREKKQPCKSD
jgi:hypothetical protein